VETDHFPVAVNKKPTIVYRGREFEIKEIIDFHLALVSRAWAE
jgi:hypothetical protein